jgi:hypothetical protein
MSAVSPNTFADALLNLTIHLNGLPIKDAYQVISVEVESDIDKFDYAAVIIADGSVDDASFPVSDTNDFVPGNKIAISAGYRSDALTNIFTGVVTAQGLTIPGESASYITVICKGEQPVVSASGLDASPLLKVAYGDSIIDFDAKLEESDDTTFVHGDVSFTGSALAKPGLTIELAGVGNRFSGIHYITGTQHEIADSNWTTSVTFDGRRP